MTQYTDFNKATSIAYVKNQHDIEWKYKVKKLDDFFLIEVYDDEGRCIGRL
jgi:hypothetical protein